MKIKLIALNADVAVDIAAALKKQPERKEKEYHFQVTQKKFAKLMRDSVIATPLLENITDNEMIFSAV